MKRVGDWEQALSEYLLSAADREYVYGEHDCMLHVANAVFAQTGIDLAAHVRGTYNTEMGSLRCLRDHFGGTVVDTLDDTFTRVPTSFAGRGDIVLFEDIPGIVYGSTALFVGQEEGSTGWVRVPRLDWEIAWSIE